jgi:adenine-specific DNA-methyltransferase
MPSLNWIGKEKIVNHDKDVPFRLLQKNKKYSLGQSENLILEGDNLEALKALMPFYYGKIKCIYIDPPYNTGNEKWVYNDRVNSPKIKEWLGKVVGPEGDDLCRHDKWLCMMYPRIKLLHDLLRNDGVIFVSIDDNEHCNLKMIMDEIFGIENFITSFVWYKKLTGGHDSKFVNVVHEYVVCYVKDITSGEIIKKISSGTEYPFFDEETGKNFKWDSLWTVSHGYTKNCDYPVTAPDGTKVFPWMCHKDKKKMKGRARWFWNYETYQEQKNKILVKKDKDGNWKVYKKVYGGTLLPPKSFFEKEKVGGTSHGKEVLEKIFNKVGVFDNPKSVELIKEIIKYSTKSSSIILDSFAGSGTTAHAVLDLNKEDGGNRKFILVELEKKIAKKITAERVKRVARGYSYKTGKGKTVNVPGLGGGFEYVEIGEPLFDKDGMINKAVSFEDMARYVYFTETRTNLEKKNIKGNHLGEFGGSHFFLLFDGIGKNVLDRKFLKGLKGVADKKVIYADKCLLDEDVLEKHHIVFKQIPYQVKIY